MVNNTSFAKRLQKICDEHELSAAAFAEKVTVGRATISHILSGRNKPSLDFVMKVTSSFPEVDLYWLLYGRGVFPKVEEKQAVEIQTPRANPIATEPTPKGTFNNKQPSQSAENLNTGVFENDIKEPRNTQKIRRVVIFFEDGHFESYEG